MRVSLIAASFVQSSPYHSSGPTPSTDIRNDQFWTSGVNYPLGHWVWMSTGEPLPEFQDWEPGEPNNAGDEHCLEFYEKDNNGYMWNDKNCMEQVYPICEYFE
ncbi:mannose binding [Homalodisca vitripennis]|nr:mannose binding [Homalodisca vitripennis]